MSIAKAKQKIEESLNYLDATEGLTSSDETNISLVMQMLDDALKELED